MKKKRFSVEQIAFAIAQSESGKAVTAICREMGISEPTFYRWRKKYAGLGVAEVRRLKQLEEENRKLKSLVADLSLAGGTVEPSGARPCDCAPSPSGRPGTGPGDCNADDIVNFDDITRVLANWLNTCP